MTRPALSKGGTGLFVSWRTGGNPPSEKRKPPRADPWPVGQLPGMLRLFRTPEPQASEIGGGQVFRSSLPPAEVLSHLPPAARLVVRTRGLTVSKHLPRGAADPLDGLSLRRPEDLELFLFPCPIDQTLVCALRNSTDGTTPLSVHFPETRWRSPETARLLRKSAAVPAEAPGIWRRGAGAWLDDGLHGLRAPAGEVLDFLALIDGSPMVHARAAGSGCSIEVRFRPVFIDLDGEVVRVADRSGRHAAFFHPLHVDSRLERDTVHLDSRIS